MSAPRKYDPSAFAAAWEHACRVGAGIKHVADAMAMSPGHAHSYASQLRRLGVKLSRMRHVPALDVAALNEKIKGWRNGEQP